MRRSSTSRTPRPRCTSGPSWCSIPRTTASTTTGWSSSSPSASRSCRYRQRIRQIPGRLGEPGVGRRRGLRRHLPRAALGPSEAGHRRAAPGVRRPHPARPLDRHRPLWEVYLVEGLEEGRFAIVTKSHQALVDGVNAVDIAHVIVDDDPAAEGLITDTWRPSHEPSDIELLTGALVDAVRRPNEIVENIRGASWTSRPWAAGPSRRPATSPRPWPAPQPGPHRPPRSTRSSARPAATS